jgi:hypothetical protein
MNLRPKRAAFACGIAIIAGVGIWWGIARSTGQLEAWDSNIYFVVGLPLLVVLVFALGYFAPQGAWRWAVAAGVGQVAAMFWLNPGTGPLLAVGLVIHAAITFGLVLAAQAGARLRHRPAG